jgi:hypothetical protein
MVRVLASVDPRDRWLAAEELGLMGARGATEALVDAAAASRFTRVRERAYAALVALVAVLPPEVRELELRQRLEALRKVAQTPALLVKVALLEELAGEETHATATYQRCLSSDPSDLFVLQRLAALRIKRGEGFGAAIAARELATRVQQLIEQRSHEEGLSSLLLARTLCGARDVAESAIEIITHLPPQVAHDFPEDLQLFTRRVSEAHKLASARLADVEADARAADRTFCGCDDAGDFRERLKEGEADRLKVVSELSMRSGDPVRFALGLAARRDPSLQVREAARAALEKVGVR